MSKPYRPWGRTSWLIGEKSSPKDWVTIGCLSTEVRSVRSLMHLSNYSSEVRAVRIIPPAVQDEDINAPYITANRKILNQHSVKDKLSESEADLKASLDTIYELALGAAAVSGDVILDITSFPKRWFFPLVRSLVNSDAVNNLMISYTRGKGYAKVVSENPEPLTEIQSFRASPTRNDHDCCFVGVGFHTHLLLELFSKYDAASMDLLFPFPPGPTRMKDNWRAVEKIKRLAKSEVSTNSIPDPIRYMHLDTSDVSRVFDYFCETTESGLKTSMFAPYGPKTFSLAMCLFSLSAEKANKPFVPVYYSQPQRYNPKYTESEKLDSKGEIESWSYSVKRDGTYLFSL
ncbi:MAG: hypothetical protein ABJO36_09455 [Litorimonas sp.]